MSATPLHREVNCVRAYSLCLRAALLHVCVEARSKQHRPCSTVMMYAGAVGSERGLPSQADSGAGELRRDVNVRGRARGGELESVTHIFPAMSALAARKAVPEMPASFTNEVWS